MQWWGPANWWLPSWLEKALPRISLEDNEKSKVLIRFDRGAASGIRTPDLRITRCVALP